MRSIFLALLVGMAVPSFAWAGKPVQKAQNVAKNEDEDVDDTSSRVENPMFYYTHLNPSPYTLPAGRFIISTDLALGVTDFFQIGTNLVADFYKVYNANAKIALLDYEGFAMALTGGWQSYNYQDIDPIAPDRRITSWMPGLVGGYSIDPAISVSLGANLNFTNQPVTTQGLPLSGYFRGASVEADAAWLYYRSKKGFANVLAGGVSYDFNYEMFGIGVSHYFKSFKLGVHYYPGSTQNRFLPIIGGSAVVDF